MTVSNNTANTMIGQLRQARTGDQLLAILELLVAEIAPEVATEI